MTLCGKNLYMLNTNAGEFVGDECYRGLNIVGMVRVSRNGGDG